LSVIGTPSSSAAVVEFDIDQGPPPARVEVVPAPRDGYIYEPGHYVYDGHAYVWHDGEYIRNREGHQYVPSEVQRHGEKWHYRGGYWDDD